MNILFLYRNPIDPEKGGIQRVTNVLTNYFIDNGINVYHLSWVKMNAIKLPSYQFYLPDSNKLYSKNNVSYLVNFIYLKKIDFVINQNGMDPVMSNLSYHIKDTPSRLISCIHNALISQINHFDTTYATKAKKYKVSWLLPLTKNRFVKKFLLFLYYKKYSKHYNLLHKNSDKVVLLSRNFIEEFEFFLSNDFDKSKLSFISNPTSFSKPKELNHLLKLKKKEILYVGRIDRRQKRVDLLLDIWEKLYFKYPDWSLKIVGGGPDLSFLISDANKRGLKNISFEGFKNPFSYYKNASILCLTSSYEGFGIVLVEAMSYGVVPIAFNSYASVTDIIDDGINGFLIPPFSVNDYAQKINDLIVDYEIAQSISLEAINKSKEFSIEKIGESWIELFDILVSK